jgi:hypothetical protein
MNGSCVEGVCECSQGYAGEFCNERLNKDFEGTFQLEENCTAGYDTYAVTLLPDAQDPSKFHAQGLWENATPVIGTIAQDGGAFVIERQPIGGHDLAGSGTMASSGQSLTLAYQIFYPGATHAFDQCTATLSK